MNLNKSIVMGIGISAFSVFAQLSSFMYQAVTIATNDPTDYRPFLIKAGYWLTIGGVAAISTYFVGGKFRVVSAILLLGIFYLSYEWIQRYPHAFS